MTEKRNPQCVKCSHFDSNRRGQQPDGGCGKTPKSFRGDAECPSFGEKQMAKEKSKKYNLKKVHGVYHLFSPSGISIKSDKDYQVVSDFTEALRKEQGIEYLDWCLLVDVFSI
jgi:hypothetical protein